MAAHMQERAIAVISKPPEQRRDPEIEMLLPWLVKKSDMFEGIEKGINSQVTLPGLKLKIHVHTNKGASREGHYMKLPDFSNFFWSVTRPGTSERGCVAGCHHGNLTHGFQRSRVLIFQTSSV